MAEITVRKCESLDEFRACITLQREIWGEEDLDVEPLTTFVVASRTGGQVLGAFDGSRMIGYTMALVGVRNGVAYLHSHATGLLPEYRDRKIGRSLKLLQRDDALGRGIRLIEWSFDPLETRNAHFNLNRLGAICRRYVSNLYGITTSPLHRGIPTDRLIAEWQLDSARVVAALATDGEVPCDAPAVVSVPQELEAWKTSDLEKVKFVQSTLREQFTNWFAKGYAAVAIRQSAAGPEYVLVPWSDF